MFTDYLWAFIVGGALCAVGQVLIDYTKLTPARTKGLLGAVTGGLSAASAGITAAMVFGLIMGVCCKSKEK